MMQGGKGRTPRFLRNPFCQLAPAELRPGPFPISRCRKASVKPLHTALAHLRVTLMVGNEPNSTGNEMKALMAAIALLCLSSTVLAHDIYSTLRDRQPHDQARARSEPMMKAGTASCIGSDMSIVGNIECKGPAQVLGRIEGEVRASDLQISDGAQIEGSVIAQNVTVCGRVKGTIRAVRVKLQNGGAVEGDIVDRTLAIE